LTNEQEIGPSRILEAEEKTLTYSPDHYRFPLKYQKRIELGKTYYGTVFEATNGETGERMIVKEIVLEQYTEERRDKVRGISGV
jgi:hypothetical protein